MNRLVHNAAGSGSALPEHAESSPIIVAAALDESFGIPLAVTLSSLVRTLDAGQEIKISILCLDVGDTCKDRIRACTKWASATVHLTFIDVDGARLENVPLLRLTRAAYLRLLLPELISGEHDRILYLDSDLLVRKNIQPLWDLPMGENLVRAAVDPFVKTVSTPGGLYNWRELGLNSDDPYFNSGILMMNLKLWRAENTTAALLRYIQDYGQWFHAHDQEALNGVCGHRWQPFDVTWNAMCLYINDYKEAAFSKAMGLTSGVLDSLQHDPSICHYAGKWKPWRPGSRPPFQREWFARLKSSGWFSPAEYRRWHASWVLHHYRDAVLRKIMKIKK